MINIIIVENDVNDMEYCCDLIECMELDINIVKAVNGKQALKWLDYNEVEMDAALLDVRLPDINGFELAAAILKMDRYKLLRMIFVTAELVNQLVVFKTYHCYDYITKPFSAQTFYEIIRPLFEALLAQKDAGKELAAGKKKSIYIENSLGKRVILVEEIFFAEITGRELLLHTKLGSYPGIKMKLKDLIRIASDPDFVQCHKSYAVNLSNAVSLSSVTKRTWSLDFGQDHSACPVSYTYYREVMKKFRMKAGADE